MLRNPKPLIHTFKVQRQIVNPNENFRLNLGKISALVCPDQSRLWQVMKNEVIWRFEIDKLTENILLMTTMSQEIPVKLNDFSLNMQDFGSIKQQALQSNPNKKLYVHLPQLGALLVYQLLLQMDLKMNSNGEISDEIIKRKFGYKVEIEAERGKTVYTSELNKLFI